MDLTFLPAEIRTVAESAKSPADLHTSLTLAIPHRLCTQLAYII